MLRSSIYSAGVVLLGASAFAQGNLSGQVHPITAPVKYAGVYHVGTGTWTQSGVPSSSAVSGTAIVYDNTCPSGYYAGTPTTGTPTFVDEGRLPSTSSVVAANAWGLGNDSEVGTQNAYTVDGFQIAYCTLEATPRSYNVNFYQAYAACAVRPATATAAFNVTGLPASATAGTQACWIVDLDLCAASLSFSMQADADGTYNGVPAQDTFGFSMQLTSAHPLGGDGPILAGGLNVAGSYQTCSGSDGTLFDTGTVSSTFPGNQDGIILGCGTIVAGATPESGSGMGSLDQFRIEGYTGLGDGCYWFGGNPAANLHLQLYSGNVNFPATNPGVAYCDPGIAGVIACPCGNPPAGTLRGCDNSAATGGASITAAGAANLAGDTLVFTTANQRPTGTTILLQGTASIATGANFGQGVRCVGGSLKRLYVKAAAGGSITAPAGADPTVSARSAALGDNIVAGQHRYYTAYYRDPVVLGGCAANATFNVTNAQDVTWN